MNEYEKKKYNTIQKMEKGEITRKEAAHELQLSLRQIDRLKHIYQIKVEKGFIHKNRRKVSNKKINKNIIEEIKQLYLDEYFDYNFEAFWDELNENEKYKDRYDISYSSLYRYFFC